MGLGDLGMVSFVRIGIAILQVVKFGLVLVGWRRVQSLIASFVFRFKFPPTWVWRLSMLTSALQSHGLDVCFYVALCLSACGTLRCVYHVMGKELGFSRWSLVRREA
jgi:hypothetical protein